MSKSDGEPAAPSAGDDDGGATPTADRHLRTDGGVRERIVLDGVGGAAAFGLAIFGVLAVGAMATSLLGTLLLDYKFTLGSTQFAGRNTDQPLFWAAFGAYTRIIQLAPILAIVIGIYLAQSADTGRLGAIRSTAANGLGAGLTFVVLTGLLVLPGFENSTPEIVQLLKPATAVTVGAIVTGAVAGYAAVALRAD